jgi:hypothetical protein
MAGGVTVAAVVVISLVLSLPEKGELNDGNFAENPKPPRAPSVVTVPLQVDPVEIAKIEGGLDQLAMDLDRLAEEAARLEALRALNELAAVHQPLNSGDST